MILQIQIKIYIEVIIKVCFLFLLELIDITITDVIKHYVKFTYWQIFENDWESSSHA